MNELRNRNASNDAANSVTPAADTVVVPLRAAKGDDDMMSQPPQLAVPCSDTGNAAWIRRVPAARIAWGKLSDLELLRTGGNAADLAGLVRDRYALTRQASEEQVGKFLAQPLD
jgi:uncharacterized protein YjbJ (UPF0337 family)